MLKLNILLQKFFSSLFDFFQYIADSKFFSYLLKFFKYIADLRTSKFFSSHRLLWWFLCVSGTLLLSLSISFFFYYFFKIPFFYADASAAEFSSTKIVETKDPASFAKLETTTEAVNAEKRFQDSLFYKSGNFLWTYKFVILTTIVVTTAVTLYTFSVIADSLHANPEDYAELVRILKYEKLQYALYHPNVPNSAGKIFFEDYGRDLFKHSLEFSSNLPEKFCGGYLSFSDEARQNIVAVLDIAADPVTQYPLKDALLVYPVKPPLHANPHNAIFDISYRGAVLGQDYDPLLLRLEPVFENSHGWSTDLAANYWIKYAIDHETWLQNYFVTRNEPSIILVYQKVALVDPSTMNYCFYHQISVRPVDLEAMLTPFETKIPNPTLKVFYFKDTEYLWYQ